jgi:hypothetical protein
MIIGISTNESLGLVSNCGAGDGCSGRLPRQTDAAIRMGGTRAHRGAPGRSRPGADVLTGGNLILRASSGAAQSEHYRFGRPAFPRLRAARCPQRCSPNARANRARRVGALANRDQHHDYCHPAARSSVIAYAVWPSARAKSVRSGRWKPGSTSPPVSTPSSGIVSNSSAEV